MNVNNSSIISLWQRECHNHATYLSQLADVAFIFYWKNGVLKIRKCFEFSFNVLLTQIFSDIEIYII